MTETRQPVDAVQALLDDLAPACDAWRRSGQPCDAPAEWFVWTVCPLCDTSGGRARLDCAEHFGKLLAGAIAHRGCCATPRGRLIVTRSERIRSKPTK